MLQLESMPCILYRIYLRYKHVQTDHMRRDYDTNCTRHDNQPITTL